MEVVSGVVDHDGVASIVASRSATTDGGSLGEDVDEFAFALVAPLRAEDEGGGHVETGSRGRTRRSGKG